MLSEDEIQEMLIDANDVSRRDSFRFSKKVNTQNMSFDEYLKFLDDVQKIFSSGKKVRNIMLTVLNKL